jgi:hypothetical protein
MSPKLLDPESYSEALAKLAAGLERNPKQAAMISIALGLDCRLCDVIHTARAALPEAVPATGGQCPACGSLPGTQEGGFRGQ